MDSCSFARGTALLRVISTFLSSLEVAAPSIGGEGGSGRSAGSGKGVRALLCRLGRDLGCGASLPEDSAGEAVDVWEPRGVMPDVATIVRRLTEVCEAGERGAQHPQRLEGVDERVLRAAAVPRPQVHAPKTPVSLQPKMHVQAMPCQPWFEIWIEGAG